MFGTCPDGSYDSNRDCSGDVNTTGRVDTKNKNNENNDCNEQKETKKLINNKRENEECLSCIKIVSLRQNISCYKFTSSGSIDCNNCEDEKKYIDENLGDADIFLN